MIWPATRRKVDKLREAVARDDEAEARSLLTHGFPVHLAVGGEACVIRAAIRNENVSLLSALIACGAQPPPEAGCYMALWVERVARGRGTLPKDASRRICRARLAMKLLSQAGVDWDKTTASLGSGDTARFVINNTWPGSLETADA